MIKKLKFFLDPFESHEKWLNNMSKKGLKLERISQTGFTYYFSKTEKNKYIYSVEFIANRDINYIQNYRNTLAEFGIKSYIKDFNLLQFSILRLKLRIKFHGNKSPLVTS
ncbi:DUF2812 domain-containing protein, partial [Clostridium sp.]